MSWWCDAGGGGVAGIAFVGALCTSYNTNLNEKQRSAAESGFVSWNEIMKSFDNVKILRCLGLKGLRIHISFSKIGSRS